MVFLKLIQHQNANNGLTKLTNATQSLLNTKSIQLLLWRSYNIVNHNRELWATDNNSNDLITENHNNNNGSLLDPCDMNLTHIQPRLKPTFNLAAYADKSETLQQLIKLGVNLHQLEKKKNIPKLILGLNFEKDIKKYLLFLHDLKVPAEEFGPFLTKNPYILQEDLDYLSARVEYLVQKKFSPVMISNVITKNPFWLLFSVERIDRRLGHFQSTYELTGKEVRKLAIMQPKIITYHLESIRLNTFSIKEEMGFEASEVKQLLLTRPKLFMMNGKNLLKRFKYINNIMKISHENVVRQPDALFCREFRLKERHQFLEKLNRAQYNPVLPNYISLIDMTSGTDQEFAVNIAKSTPTIYNAFLKTL